MSRRRIGRGGACRHTTASLFEAVEPRRLFTFAVADNSFGQGGHTSLVADPLAFGNAIHVTAIADGRLVAANDLGVFYLRGDGTIDPKRGGQNGMAGSRRFASQSALATDVATDPLTGRIAVLRPSSNTIVLELYDAKGRLGATRVMSEQPRHIAFGPSGDVFVVSERFDYLQPGDPESRDADHYAEVRRFDGNLAPRTDYGDHGVATVKYAANVQESTQGDFASIAGLFIDGSNRAYFTTTIDDETNSYTGSVSANARRFTSTGVADTSYGSNGAAFLYSYDTTTDDSASSINTLDTQLTADGRLIYVTRLGTSSDYGPNQTRFELSRLDADGITKVKVDADGATQRPSTLEQPAQLSIAADGSVYVALASHETRHFLADQLKSDPNWSTFGNVAFSTTALRVSDLVALPDGRLLRASLTAQTTTTATLSLLVTKGTADSLAPDLGSNSFRLLSDGTLVVNGSAKADAIEVRIKKGDALITISGRTNKLKKSAINEVVINAGGGNDKVNVTLPAYVDGGSGNDNIIASGGGEYSLGSTIVGGSGNDRLQGSILDDSLYGQDGNDTIVALSGADVIYGGNGDDLIYSGTVPTSGVSGIDYNTDYVVTGRGKDTYYVDHGQYYPSEDLVDRDETDVSKYY